MLDNKMVCGSCGDTQPFALDKGAKQPAKTNTAPSQNYAIWNPNATANWSLIFSPAFGSYLQMLNWKALGQPDKAASSQNWFYASLAILVAYVLMGIFMADSIAAGNAVHGLGFLYLLVWYFSVGRSQGKFVKEKFGPNYPKKPWGKALFVGIASMIGYFMFAVVVGLFFDAATSKTTTHWKENYPTGGDNLYEDRGNSIESVAGDKSGNTFGGRPVDDALVKEGGGFDPSKPYTIIHKDGSHEDVDPGRMQK